MVETTSPLELAARLVEACPTPALLAGPSDSILRTNEAASALLGVPATPQRGDLRAHLGVGWLELDTTARDGRADVVVSLRGLDGRPRDGRWRARLEAVAGNEPGERAVAVFLERAPDHPGGGLARGAAARGFDALRGSDPALVQTKRAAQRFAATNVPILLLAETGTGKELLARAIHAASPRRDRPFVAINCGALSPHLLESELFGYAPGAFTGASREGNEGKVGAARGGTLFLDEIAEMPESLQALLLRVLEDGTYYRVGESRPRHADVRLLCATCQDLPALVGSGDFREDLYYRVNGACLTLPPLRRRNDLAELLPDVLESVAEELGVDALPRLADSAMARLIGAPWPGNVRQLKSALRYALIVCDGGPIENAHLPADLGSPYRPGTSNAAPPASGDAAPDAPPPVAAAASPVRTLRELERDRLEQALSAARGNLSRAARQLGVARSTLYRRLRRHGFLP